MHRHGRGSTLSRKVHDKISDQKRRGMSIIHFKKLESFSLFAREPVRID